MSLLYIAGTSGLARELAQAALRASASCEWESLHFIGESADVVGTTISGMAVVGVDAYLVDLKEAADVLIGIGRPKIRLRLFERYRANAHLRFPNLVDARAVCDLGRVELGLGNVVMPGCQFTCDIRVGHHNYFNLSVTVGHNVVVGDGLVANPGASIAGNVRIGDGVLVGSGAQILEGLVIGDGAVIGAGAVVTRDVPAGITVVGIPARPTTSE